MDRDGETWETWEAWKPRQDYLVCMRIASKTVYVW